MEKVTEAQTEEDVGEHEYVSDPERFDENEDFEGEEGDEYS